MPVSAKATSNTTSTTRSTRKTTVTTSTTIITLIYALAHQFQAGYHISALNGIQSSLVCDGVPRPPVGNWPGPPHGHVPGSRMEEWGNWAMVRCGFGELDGCIDMTSSRFGLIVAMFTLGGLLGSLSAERITRSLGRIGALRFATALSTIASLFFALANTSDIMLICRGTIGFACGLTGVNVPLLATELRPNLKQTLGITCQLTVVAGLIAAQAISLAFAKSYLWRWEMVVAAGVGCLLLFGSLFASQDDDVHPPSQGIEERATGQDGGEQEYLLQNLRKGGGKHLSIGEILRSEDPVVQTGLTAIVISQIAQQASGISPVVYFSTSILRPVFPGNSGLIAVLILCIKFPASLLTLPILPRWGSCLTLTRSYLFMALSLFLLAFGLNYDIALLSCSSIVLFFLGYGLGPGPVPFVILSEVLPVEARTAAGSLGLACNAVTGFIVSSAFLPLQELFTTSPGRGEGNIFFLFGVACLAAVVALEVVFKRYHQALESA